MGPEERSLRHTSRERIRDGGLMPFSLLHYACTWHTDRQMRTMCEQFWHCGGWPTGWDSGGGWEISQPARGLYGAHLWKEKVARAGSFQPFVEGSGLFHGMCYGSRSYSKVAKPAGLGEGKSTLSLHAFMLPIGLSTLQVFVQKTNALVIRCNYSSPHVNSAGLDFDEQSVAVRNYVRRRSLSMGGCWLTAERRPGSGVH